VGEFEVAKSGGIWVAIRDLCEFVGAGGKPWRGVRRFKATTTGKPAFDHSGRGNFMPLSGYEAGCMKVLGRVEQVYRAVD